MPIWIVSRHALNIPQHEFVALGGLKHAFNSRGLYFNKAPVFVLKINQSQPAACAFCRTDELEAIFRNGEYGMHRMGIVQILEEGELVCLAAILRRVAFQSEVEFSSVSLTGCLSKTNPAGPFEQFGEVLEVASLMILHRHRQPR